jgi:predicted nucleic acid-binding Zn ribbon protein
MTPMFEIVAAAVVLFGAGYYVSNRRSRKREALLEKQRQEAH